MAQKSTVTYSVWVNLRIEQKAEIVGRLDNDELFLSSTNAAIEDDVVEEAEVVLFDGDSTDDERSTILRDKLP